MRPINLTHVKFLFGIVDNQDFSTGRLTQGSSIIFSDWVVHFEGYFINNLSQLYERSILSGDG
jgi:hypothetical protein